MPRPSQYDDTTSTESESGRTEYQYPKILRDSSIRLLKLKPRRKKEIICELTEYSLTEDARMPIFEAVSWAWGGSVWSGQITVRENNDDFYLRVPENLVSALSALQDRRTPRFLWVDAICINQKIVEEKNYQVPMMSLIYGRARSVCIWLGDADSDSQMALDFIEREILRQDIDSLCDDPQAAPKWRAMFKLMQRSWFSRRWVVQELALAKDATIYCGKFHIPWGDFSAAVQAVVDVENSSHRISKAIRRDRNSYFLPGLFDHVSSLGASVLVDATGFMFRKSRNNQLRPLLSLEYLVSSLYTFQITEPRDSIYSLLAISKDVIPVQITQEEENDFRMTKHPSSKSPYPVDYRQSYIDICKQFIIFSVRRSDQLRALDILCRPWAPEPTRMTGDAYHNEQSPVPSWICTLSGAANAVYEHPDSEMRLSRMNADSLVGLPSPAQPRYSASGTIGFMEHSFQFKKRANFHSMYVSGFILERVEKVEVCSQNGFVPGEWLQLGGWNDTSQEPPDQLWRTLVADRDRLGRNHSPNGARIFKESITKGLLGGFFNTTELVNGRSSVNAEVFRRVQAVIWNRALMRTELGNLGIVRKGVESGDLVCILYGCSVPVILRRYLKTEQDLAEEKDLDRAERKEQLQKLAIMLLKRFRERKNRNMTNGTASATKSSVQVPRRQLQPRAGLDGATNGHVDLEGPLNADANSQSGDEQGTTSSPGVDRKGSEQVETEYYELLGECYVHGMMDGESLGFKKKHVILTRQFEIR